MRIIGHERRFQADPSAVIRSRFYANSVDDLDLVNVVEGDTLTIWFEEGSSLAYYGSVFGGDGDIDQDRLKLASRLSGTGCGQGKQG